MNVCKGNCIGCVFQLMGKNYRCSYFGWVQRLSIFTVHVYWRYMVLDIMEVKMVTDNINKPVSRR